MEDAVLPLLGERNGARAVRGKQAFELVAGRGANKLAGFRREAGLPKLPSSVRQSVITLTTRGSAGVVAA